MTRKGSLENNPSPHITRAECKAISGKLDLALFGKDGRGGIVNDIAGIRSDQRIIKKSVKNIENHRKSGEEEEKKKRRDWRGLIYSVIGGLIVAGVSWGLANIHF